MFNGAAAFNADLSKWVTSSVTSMMFVCCERDCVALSGAVARVRPRFHPMQATDAVVAVCVSCAPSRRRQSDVRRRHLLQRGPVEVGHVERDDHVVRVLRARLRGPLSGSGESAASLSSDASD